MFLRELFETDSNTAVIAFGRMNPPTIGHKKLVEKIKSIPGDHFLFLSQSQKPKTDPLDFQTKLKLAQSFFPGITVGDPEVKTVMQAMQKIQNLGYKNVIYVAGSDRVPEFEKLLNAYNGKDYTFNSIKIVSAGERDPDAEGVEGMSASKMRAAAAAGNFEAFKSGTPDPAYAELMYNEVRAGMGINKESISEDLSVTPDLLKKLEFYLDKMFSSVGIDVEFTKHFLDRVNDPRNGQPITIQELAKIFKDEYAKYGKKIAQLGPNAQAVMKDMSTDVNIPFVLSWDNNKKELDLIAKTVMRKKNFTTPNQEFRV